MRTCGTAGVEMICLTSLLLSTEHLDVSGHDGGLLEEAE